MKKFFTTPKGLFTVWAVLVGLTVLSMVNAQAGSDVTRLSTFALAVLFGLSMLKAEGILRYFLDLQNSTPGWRHFFTAMIGVMAFLLFALTAVKL